MNSTATVRDKVRQIPVQGWWFPPGTLASSATKTEHHDIAEFVKPHSINQSINFCMYWIFTIDEIYLPMMRLIVEYIQAICCSSDADADSTCMSVLDVDLVVV